MRRYTRGEGKAGCIFYLAILFIGVFLAYRFVPPKIAHAQLKDYAEEISIHNPRKDAKWFKKQILNRARDLDVPLDAKGIEIEKQGIKRIKIRVTYVRVLDLVVTDFEMKQEFFVDRDLFIV
ncbi:MAG: hypothetical protein AAGN46_13620 [Acidobacteriota bacterium]